MNSLFCVTADNHQYTSIDNPGMPIKNVFILKIALIKKSNTQHNKKNYITNLTKV